MKHPALLFLLSFLLLQCAAPKEEEVKEDVVKITHERLIKYPLTATDTVYAVSVKLSSTDTVEAEYSVQLIQGTTIFKDSLVFGIAKNEDVLGELIFPDCKVAHNKKPSFTSKIKIIGSK